MGSLTSAGSLHPVVLRAGIHIACRGLTVLEEMLNCVSSPEIQEVMHSRPWQVDMVLYAASSSLKFLSLIRLRVTEPDANRPFRIPAETGLLSCKPLPVVLHVTCVLLHHMCLWKYRLHELADHDLCCHDPSGLTLVTRVSCNLSVSVIQVIGKWFLSIDFHTGFLLSLLLHIIVEVVLPAAKSLWHAAVTFYFSARGWWRDVVKPLHEVLKKRGAKTSCSGEAEKMLESEDEYNPGNDVLSSSTM